MWGISGGQAELAVGAHCQDCGGKEGIEESLTTEVPFPRALAIALLASVTQSGHCRQIKKESRKISY